MAPRISLALAIHNHQPVGNFGWVFAEVFERAYRPMLDALERHPGVRLSLHYTGPLLEWLRRERPEFVERLRVLASAGRVELLGGGYYEPVLASLPERDRIGQLLRMGDELEATFGRRPRGAWLAERVWEPDLPTALAGAGYRWTILDDAHFRAAAIPEENLWGAYTTEDQANLLTVFGTEQGLRYRIPFGEVDDVIGYLRQHATEDGRRVGMMGDDGEKFGAWPTTWEHCWGARRWVDRFFDALEANADWLSTVTPSAWLEREPPIGRVYVPTGSYAEMGEWALPAAEAQVYAPLLHAAVTAKRPEARYLRGGFWRNFQVKYREINDLHKQMLRTSAKVHGMRAAEAAGAPGVDAPTATRALDHLFQGQSNDCYWHGLFGGIYLAHMRLATAEHLIAAEDLADTAASARGERVDRAELVDVDLDGIAEVLLTAPGQVVTVKLDEGAGIGGWDVRPVRHALASVMRRRPEAYHAILLAHETAASSAPDPGPTDGPSSIHELVRVKESGLAERLHYDDHERRSGLVRFLAPDTTPEAVAAGRETELGDAVVGAFEVLELAEGRLVVVRVATLRGPDGADRTVRVTKTLELGGDRRTPTLALEVALEQLAGSPLETRLGLEWTLMMLGGGGNPAAWWEVDATRSAHDGVGEATGIAALASGNDDVGIRLDTAVEPAGDAWWAPIETISNSESGFERVYQGSGLMLSWPLRLATGERRTVRVMQRVSTTRDRAAAEA